MTTEMRSPILRLTAFGIVVALMSWGIVTAISRPLPGDKATYRAVFSDVSGLFSGDPVRQAGVLVGEVRDIAIDRGNAVVTFEVQRGHRPGRSARAAVRYQNLIGQRYLEVVPGPHEATESRLDDGAVIPLERTIPSFDITRLFNGVGPLLASFDPAAFNDFAANILTVLEGDGRGYAPVLESLDRLTALARDREAVILTLIANLGAVADEIGGRSARVAGLITVLNGAVTKFTGRIDEVDRALHDADRALVPATELLEMMSGSYDYNYGPLDAFLRRVLPATPQIVEALGTIPTLLSAINSAVGTHPSAGLTCSRGQLTSTALPRLLVGGKELRVCR
ncbi:MlaD family protein [Gordonia aurantiaca]|uniref:MlaD family protein n=1 Tax=Gordonia sp. B21 TaxID=3151852 RepID=UPI0032652F19